MLHQSVNTSTPDSAMISYRNRLPISAVPDAMRPYRDLRRMLVSIAPKLRSGRPAITRENRISVTLPHIGRRGSHASWFKRDKAD